MKRRFGHFDPALLNPVHKSFNWRRDMERDVEAFLTKYGTPPTEQKVLCADCPMRQNYALPGRLIDTKKPDSWAYGFGILIGLTMAVLFRLAGVW